MRIAIVGAAGRMGKTLIEAVSNSNELRLTAAFENESSPYLGQDAGELAGIGKLNLPLGSSLNEAIDDFDIVIDFTVPDASMNHLEICKKNKKKIVIGTTGFSNDQKKIIINTSKKIPIVLAPNMSIGVNLCFKLLEVAAKVIGKDSDVEIIEAHHRHKVDAPSGTALKMGEIISDELGLKLEDVAVFGREGLTGERNSKTIGFETIRAGDIIGEHSAWFVALGERVEITHKASSRMTFAQGALRAAAWLDKKSHGLFDMQDVLQLK
tara:strand:+ start:8928 stop:9728 length:801 start_codon:yes stop_codon:yes gene_type:complete